MSLLLPPPWSPNGGYILFTRFVNGYNAEPADLFVTKLGDNSVRTLVSIGTGNVNLRAPYGMKLLVK